MANRGRKAVNASQPEFVKRARALRLQLKDLDSQCDTRIVWTADSQLEVAEFFGVSIDTVKSWTRKNMPGAPKAYRLDKIAQWLRTEGPGSSRIQASDDPLLGEGESPALERYRLAKAQHAELDLEERRGNLIDKSKCRDVLSMWAGVIRKLGESIGRRFGVEAHREINDALDECASIVRSMDNAGS